MDFRQRDDLISFLNKIESVYPVNDWHSYGMKYWPLLKNIIFFSEYKSAKSNNILNKFFVKKIIKRLKFLFNKLNYLSAQKNYKSMELQPTDFIFVTATTYRSHYNGNYFSRYFDPMMDYLESRHNIESLQFDYLNTDTNKCYKPDRNFDVTKIFAWYNVQNECKVDLHEDSTFQKCIEEIVSNIKLSKQQLLANLENAIKDILTWKMVWQDIIKKCKPKVVVGLCYYSNPGYGLTLAANELGVISVDMQHGGQGQLHPSYYFTNLDNNGNSLLPSIFWVWNNNSRDNIKKWIDGNKHHEVLLGGNPWIDFLSNESSTSEMFRNKKVILYTLQPSLHPILHERIISAIKQSGKDYSWWLRLHPRMTNEERQELTGIIEKAQLTEKVEIEKASSIPLPILLKHSVAHISNFSGSIEEAAIMGVPINIILHEIGKKSYQTLIENNDAQFFDINSNSSLIDFIMFLELKEDNEDQVVRISYKDILDSMVAKFKNIK